MKVKKYTARTEAEAITSVKEELGLDAIVLSIKKIQPKGWFAFLRKPHVEVTAAYDVKPPETAPKAVARADVKVDETGSYPTRLVYGQQRKITDLENALPKEDIFNDFPGPVLAAPKPETGRGYENAVVRSFYDSLLAQGVEAGVTDYLLNDAAQLDAEEADVGLISRVVYNNIINVLNKPGSGNDETDTGCRVHIFMGPTGVGKTTTIAKLLSDLVLNHNLRIGLITADTYRIAAVEQLRTYAEILSVEVGVAYSARDFAECMESLKTKYDMILVDTAGRSHKNTANLNELSELLESCPNAQKHLVLSLTTKYEDLLGIVESYLTISDFDIIFTKMDETLDLGSVLNICYYFNKKVSYLTNGQNVPDDIEPLEPEKIAKALLGLNWPDKRLRPEAG